MTSEIRKKYLKKGFAKVIDEEKSILTIGSMKLGKKSKWAIKYLMLIRDQNGISSLMIYDNESDADNHQPKKIIVIDANTEAKQIQPIDGESFCLIIYNNTKESVIMACNFYGELIDWQSYLNEEVNNIKLAESKSKMEKLPPLPRRPRNPERESREDSRYMCLREEHTHSEVKEISNKYDTENNEIYGGTNIYTVEIVENDTAKKLNLHGNYSLQLYDDGFQLLDKESERILFSWQVQVLRRYGSSNNRFTFESGRRSESGPGNFVFLTPFCKLIYQEVNEMTNRVKKSSSSTDLQRDDSIDSGNAKQHERVQKLDSREQIVSNSPDLRPDDPKRRYHPGFDAKRASTEDKSKAKIHSTSLSEAISESGHLIHQTSYNRSPSPVSPLANVYHRNKQQSDLARERFAERTEPMGKVHENIQMRESLDAPQEINFGRVSPHFISPNASPKLKRSDTCSDDEDENRGQHIIKSTLEHRDTNFDLNLERENSRPREDYVNVPDLHSDMTHRDPSIHHFSPERAMPNYENSISGTNRWRSESEPNQTMPFFNPQPAGGGGIYMNIEQRRSSPSESTVKNEPQMYSNQQLMQQQLLGAPFPQERPFFQPQFNAVPEQTTELQYGGYNLPKSLSSLGIGDNPHMVPQPNPDLQRLQPFDSMRYAMQTNSGQCMSIQQTSSFPNSTITYPILQQDQYMYPQSQEMVQNPYNFQLPPHSHAPTAYGYPMSGPSLMGNPLPQNLPPDVFPKSAPTTLNHPQHEYRRPDQ